MELTREHFRAIIFYDFKAGLNQEQYVQRLQLAFDDESQLVLLYTDGLKNLVEIAIFFKMKNTRKAAVGSGPR